MGEKKLVYEVSIIRPLVIFLLVVFHCLCIYSGNWDSIISIHDVPIYYWMANLISGIQLQTMAVVSGYIFAFQCVTLQKKYNFKNLMIKKAERLLIPCYIFGIIYFILILLPLSDYSFSDFLFLISNGAGHLWFLPMLFWCFVFLWLIHHYQPNKFWTFITLSVISILPMPSLPFGLTRMPHFAFYAYAGYCLWIYREQIFEKFLKRRWIILFITAYLVLLYMNCSLKHFGAEEYELPLYAKIITRVLKYFIVFTGISALYLIVCSYTINPHFKPANWVIQSSKICYGVYIFHQFILKYLYYQTPLPEYAGSYWLPWIALSIALPLSIILSILFLRTKFGRFLIG